jgi:hypothetical protein
VKLLGVPATPRRATSERVAARVNCVPTNGSDRWDEVHVC